MADKKLAGLLDRLPKMPSRENVSPTYAKRPASIKNATPARQVYRAGGPEGRSPASGTYTAG